MAAIEATELVKIYRDDIQAVRGVSFAVAEGEIFGYLGRNGSGKTTTVRMLTTLTRPTAGWASVAGIDVVERPTEVKALIGVTMQEVALDPQMTGAEHLQFIAGILGHGRRSAAARATEMLTLFGLQDAASRAIGTYSGGMKRRLDIATALLGEARVLFLDEPTVGLDPQSRRALWDELRGLKRQGVTVFLTTQYLEEADQMADRIAIVDRGKIIALGTASELKRAHGRKQISFDRAGGGAGPQDLLATALGHEVFSTEGRVRVEVAADFGDGELLSLLDRLSEATGGLHGLEVADTSLEDVFLRLTGTAISEGAESFARGEVAT